MDLLVNPSSSCAFITVGTPETITWDFQGIPANNFFNTSNSCSYKADTNFWVCYYGMTDPPYGNEITFTASITPNQGPYPRFNFGYYDINDTYKNIKSLQWVLHSPPQLMTLATSFYIPASAKSFSLIYSSNGSGTGVTNIQMDFTIANYDPCLANLLGGNDINPDTDYCDEGTQPGAPRIRKYYNKKGAGPGR
jgi:hypothetical protein